VIVVVIVFCEFSQFSQNQANTHVPLSHELTFEDLSHELTFENLYQLSLLQQVGVLGRGICS